MPLTVGDYGYDEEDPSVNSLIITTLDLNPPDGRRFWLDDSMFPLDDEGMHVPRFSVQETAKCFFGQNSEWLRWRMRDHVKGRTGQLSSRYFTLDGEPMEFKRIRSKHGGATARYYTLADVERMAHALAQNGAIGGGDLVNVIVMIRTCARLHRVPV